MCLSPSCSAVMSQHRLLKSSFRVRHTEVSWSSSAVATNSSNITAQLPNCSTAQLLNWLTDSYAWCIWHSCVHAHAHSSYFMNSPECALTVDGTLEFQRMQQHGGRTVWVCALWPCDIKTKETFYCVNNANIIECNGWSGLDIIFYDLIIADTWWFAQLNEYRKQTRISNLFSMSMYVGLVVQYKNIYFALKLNIVVV